MASLLDGPYRARAPHIQKVYIDLPILDQAVRTSSCHLTSGIDTLIKRLEMLKKEEP